uniref:Uncharacterized protein n=1 Tax=Oryza sativa subsp. japonica TaxID=39947 RepID=Q5Z4A7_ORYSJ|nr:hypothetical protein [Oryza sativa Japonica Group]BAD62425.1 hypothetical protein [Oryza sativa Japonica Group]
MNIFSRADLLREPHIKIPIPSFPLSHFKSSPISFLSSLSLFLLTPLPPHGVSHLLTPPSSPLLPTAAAGIGDGCARRQWQRGGGGCRRWRAAASSTRRRPRRGIQRAAANPRTDPAGSRPPPTRDLAPLPSPSFPPRSGGGEGRWRRCGRRGARIGRWPAWRPAGARIGWWVSRRQPLMTTRVGAASSADDDNEGGSDVVGRRGGGSGWERRWRCRF